MAICLTFLGAAGTVTGSKYLLECNGKNGKPRRFLIDSGLFQGDREIREQNWADQKSLRLSEIDAVLLTHAHLDHSGILPRYRRFGLTCPIYCTRSTRQLCEILLTDSAALQEEEAGYRQKTGKSRHKPPLPLYSMQDAEAVLGQFQTVQFGKEIDLFSGIKATWSPVGHILGAAAINIQVGERTFTFSGDIGRYGLPFLREPQPINLGETLLIESTYGDTLHSPIPVDQQLAAAVNEAHDRGGVMIIPSFAIGRTQLLLYLLRELKGKGAIPNVPVYVDSPMACDVTDVYEANSGEFSSEARELMSSGVGLFDSDSVHFVRTSDESKRLNHLSGSAIIISASGMLMGGRILHHLKHRIGDPRTTILFVGFQPPGSRGAWIKSGAKSLRLFSDEYQIRAQVREISALSAHADQADLLRWCRECQGQPKQVFVVHGEQKTAESFAAKLSTTMGWNASVPKLGQKFETES